jgi:hypothetical protein
MERDPNQQPGVQGDTRPLEEQVRQLTVRVTDLERRLFELEDETAPQVE